MKNAVFIMTMPRFLYFIFSVSLITAIHRPVMKTVKTFIFSLLAIASLNVSAQTNAETTKRIVENRNFIFVANSAQPTPNNDLNKVFSAMPGVQSGSNISLNSSQYTVVVNKDSIVSFLPFYGRAYTVNPNPDESGIKFTSKSFTYKETKNKKGIYTIDVKTKDTKSESYTLTFSISTNGYASLFVSGNNKQPISFSGYLSEPKEAKDQ